METYKLSDLKISEIRNALREAIGGRIPNYKLNRIITYENTEKVMVIIDAEIKGVELLIGSKADNIKAIADELVLQYDQKMESTTETEKHYLDGNLQLLNKAFSHFI